MSQSPTPLETAHGYSPPTVTQFSVFLANKVGSLADLVEAFEDSSVTICALSVHEASDHAVVRLITNNANEGAKVLGRVDLPFTTRDVLVVELSGGHTLASMCLHLLAAASIQFAYPLMMRQDAPAIALAVDDMTLAGQILRRKDFRLLGEADLTVPKG